MNEQVVGSITELDVRDDKPIEKPFVAAVAPQPADTEAGGKKEKKEKKSNPPLDMKNFDTIQEMLRNSESDPAEISRLITQEIQAVTRDLVFLRNDPSLNDTYKLRTYTEAYKALKELRQSVMDTEMLSKKDLLNFDGDKLKFYTSKLLTWFTEAMKSAGLREDMCNSVMKHYRDIAITGEPVLRRDVQQIESGLRRK